MYLFGASGHAKVIIEILEAQKILIDGLFDDNDSLQSLLEYEIQNSVYSFDRGKQLIVSIGNNVTRKKVVSKLDASYGTTIHPTSTVSKRSSIGEGSVIMAGVVINAASTIGAHCIINTNASVDHDCVLEGFVHISPNVALCGNVVVGEGTHVGAGTVVIPGKKIGKWCTIGAGSVVISDIPDFATAVGNPCKVIKSTKARS